MADWKVLVVDDEPLNLEIISEFLDDPSYLLECFLSADEAWPQVEAAYLNQAPYDLVILDRMMPGMDGMSFLRLLKADERFKHVPVIMQTAAAAPEQVQEGITAGAYYYLAKPYPSATLIATVRAALDEVRQRRQNIQVFPSIAAPNVGEVAHYQFRTLCEARTLAVQLSAWCPNPDLVAMGLIELFVNAIEHGNLGISYQEKAQLRLADQWEDEIERRLAAAENKNKIAQVDIERLSDRYVFTVTDCGVGFDWMRYLEIDPARAFDPNGRGIAMAKQMSFSSIEYRGSGNVVLASVSLTAALQTYAPTHQ